MPSLPTLAETDAPHYLRTFAMWVAFSQRTYAELFGRSPEKVRIIIPTWVSVYQSVLAPRDL